MTPPGPRQFSVLTLLLHVPLNSGHGTWGCVRWRTIRPRPHRCLGAADDSCITSRNELIGRQFPTPDETCYISFAMLFQKGTYFSDNFLPPHEPQKCVRGRHTLQPSRFIY